MNKTEKLLLFCALALTALLSLGQFFHYPSDVREVATGQFPDGLRLVYPALYVFLAPFFQFADHWTILSYKQHLSFLAVLILGWCILRMILKDSGRVNFKKEIGYFIAFFAVYALIAGAIVLLPRPMAKLKTFDPDLIAVDFHSHTNCSWDARKSFTPEKNLLWHQKAGFHASFITDHNVFDCSKKMSAEIGSSRIVSMKGEEVSLYKSHWVVLGIEEEISNREYDDGLSEIGLFLKNIKRSADVAVIASLPEYWFYHWGGNLKTFVQWDVDGFEIANSAPLALDFPSTLRNEMINFCRQNNLVMTGITDSHGWGSTCYVWNILRIKDWRMLSKQELEKAVLSHLKKERFNAVRVVTRVKNEPCDCWFGMAADPFLQIWETSRSMPLIQAGVSVVWIWLPFIFIRFAKKW